MTPGDCTRRSRDESDTLTKTGRPRAIAMERGRRIVCSHTHQSNGSRREARGILKRSHPTSAGPGASHDDDTKAESNAERGADGASGRVGESERVRASEVEAERGGV